jgi:hypothetical protein
MKRNKRCKWKKRIKENKKNVNKGKKGGIKRNKRKSIKIKNK